MWKYFGSFLQTGLHDVKRRQVTNIRIERERLSGRSCNRMLTGHYALGSWQIDDQVGQLPEP